MSLLQVVSKDLVRRVFEAVPDGLQVGGNVPYEYIRETLDAIQELEAKRAEDSKKMDCRMKEVRAIEALSLNSCKTGNMTNLPALDALFDQSYRVSLRERLQWALRTERGNEMAMIEKLCEHTEKELPRIREEKEEEEEEAPAVVAEA
uniref:PHTB1_C domain-containing protein n=1 Tax=Caenorhabditis japonica TaxID=281687 RepID=A0A8R1EE22_CAEJA